MNEGAYRAGEAYGLLAHREAIALICEAPNKSVPATVGLIAVVERIHAIAAVADIELRAWGERVEDVGFWDRCSQSDESAECEDEEELHLEGCNAV